MTPRNRLRRRRDEPRGEEHVEVLDLGVRWAAGAPMPFVVSSEHHTAVVCRTADANEARDRFAIIEFDRVRELRFGGPAEDGLDQHPLSGRGLTWFAAHEVHESQWIPERVTLDAHGDPGAVEAWVGMRHFFLTFHDRALEVFARGISVRAFVGTGDEAREEGFRVVSSGEDGPIWLT